MTTVPDSLKRADKNPKSSSLGFRLIRLVTRYRGIPKKLPSVPTETLESLSVETLILPLGCSSICALQLATAETDNVAMANRIIFAGTDMVISRFGN